MKKGFILITVVLFSIMVMATVITALYFSQSKIKAIENYEERLRAHYLCEAGLSAGIDALRDGRLLSRDPDTPNKFIFSIGSQSYTIEYFNDPVSGFASNNSIQSRVTMPKSNLTYHMRIGAKRSQWPVFIKGYLPPLMD